MQLTISRICKDHDPMIQHYYQPLLLPQLRPPPPPNLPLRCRPHGRCPQQLLGRRVHEELQTGGKFKLWQRWQAPPTQEAEEKRGFFIRWRRRAGPQANRGGVCHHPALLQRRRFPTLRPDQEQIREGDDHVQAHPLQDLARCLQRHLPLQGSDIDRAERISMDE